MRTEKRTRNLRILVLKVRIAASIQNARFAWIAQESKKTNEHTVSTVHWTLDRWTVYRYHVSVTSYDYQYQ